MHSVTWLKMDVLFVLHVLITNVLSWHFQFLLLLIRPDFFLILSLRKYHHLSHFLVFLFFLFFGPCILDQNYLYLKFLFFQNHAHQLFHYYFVITMMTTTTSSSTRQMTLLPLPLLNSISLFVKKEREKKGP